MKILLKYNLVGNFRPLFFKNQPTKKCVMWTVSTAQVFSRLVSRHVPVGEEKSEKSGCVQRLVGITLDLRFPLASWERAHIQTISILNQVSTNHHSRLFAISSTNSIWSRRHKQLRSFLLICCTYGWWVNLIRRRSNYNKLPKELQLLFE